MVELGLCDTFAYGDYLQRTPEEWAHLDAFCRISISRFYRDRAIFTHLREIVLPALARKQLSVGGDELRCWSLGCASGEEAYTLSILWTLSIRPRFPKLSFRITATDVDENLIARAERGCYKKSSLRDMPADLLIAGFDQAADLYCVKPRLRKPIEFRVEDVRCCLPLDTFHLILCRNFVFTYFSDELQRATLASLLGRLTGGGFFVAGQHEDIPRDVEILASTGPHLRVYQSRAGS
jgi:chemotaxis protein methyltransferase CheR